jgi:hypothetical protein
MPVVENVPDSYGYISEDRHMVEVPSPAATALAEAASACPCDAARQAHQWSTGHFWFS